MTASTVAVPQPRRSAPMQTVNFITDLVTLLVVLAMVATGLLLRFVLPPGSRGGQGLQLWGLNRHELGDVHFWLAVAMATLFILHIALHWTWVCAFVSRRMRAEGTAPTSRAGRRRVAYGVSLLLLVIAILGGFLWIASASATRASDSDEGGGRRRRGGRGAAVIQPPGEARPIYVMDER